MSVTRYPINLDNLDRTSIERQIDDLEVFEGENEILSRLTWKDHEIDDERMKGLKEGIYYLYSEKDAEMAVVGSRKQVWIRGKDRTLIDKVQKQVVQKKAFESDVVVPLSSKYHVVLSLLNEGASSVDSWNPECLRSSIERALSDAVDVRLSSQVRYFVDSDRKDPHHWSSDVVSYALEKQIDLVVFNGRNKNTSSSGDALIIPGIGCITHEWNPKALQMLLKNLLGFPSYEGCAKEIHFVDCDFSELELQAWKVGLSNLFEQSARKTLQSLPALFDSISGLAIPKETAEKIDVAVSMLSNDPKQSWELAEEVYFDKDNLPLLYFPYDHKIAVYLPVFFPPFYALLTAWIKVIKKMLKKRRERKKKQD